MSEDPEDTRDYLWDRSQPADPDVQALEDLLGRYSHDARAASKHPAATPRPRRRAWVPLAAIALMAIGVALWQVGSASVLRGIQLELIAGQLEDSGGEILIASESGCKLQLTGEDGSWIGDLTFSPRSRFEVETLDRGLARLFLGQGRLEASISETAPARFFQVNTPSARCVDLGCEYVLEVDEQGAAQVTVATGKVSFGEPEGRERYVPAGAECKATLDRGTGTPRFPTGTPEFNAILDEFDGAVGEPAPARRRLAEGLSSSAAPIDTLALWHLLDDPDEEVRAIAQATLFRIAELPPSAVILKIVTPSREAWREHLEELWR